jgi:hypothetical protein
MTITGGAVTGQLLANFLTKFGGYFDALPEINTIADLLPFEQKAKLGSKYEVSFLVGMEHGHTASRQGGLYTLKPAVGAELQKAELDGSTITMRAQYAWDDVYASLNGSDASYNDIMSLKMKALGKGASLYRDLALAYGPGAGSVLGANIGVVKTTAGAALNADLTNGVSIFLTKSSFIRGLWPSMRNAYVDIYQSDGTTLRCSNVRVIGVPNQRKTQVTFVASSETGYVSSAPGATVAANDVIVPAGWKGQSCIGLESIMRTQTGTLFTVNMATITPFRTPLFSANNGPLTLQLIREWAALIADNGSTQGGQLMCSGSAFAALANEYSAKNRDTSQGGVKKQGESKLIFETPAGDIDVTVWNLAKQGSAMYVANSARAYRVGTTDNTMRPIKGLNEGFLTPLIDQPGLQSSIYSNQAPFCENGWHNFFVEDIVSPGDSAES